MTHSLNQFATIVLIIIHLSANSLADSNDKHIVTTSAGNVAGVYKATRWGNVIQYYGIPYAVPMTKSGRFKDSVPLLGQDYSQHTKDNPAFLHNLSPSPACVQPMHLKEFSHPSLPVGGVKVDEDCLNLNIYQPADMESTNKIPIVLWVPGDGYSFSDSNQYDGSALAAKGKVIVVVLNYRVGVFGFASMGNVTLTGNFGLGDIISSLQFIRHNAQAFNGDYNQVTLAGRFSGAMAISTLLTSPSFYGSAGNKDPMAKRVIIHGGAATSKYSIDTDPSEKFQKLVTATGCNKGNYESTLSCLQSLEASELQEKATQVSFNWRPSIDGINVRQTPIEAIEFGKFSSEITFLVGDNSGSGSICYDTQKYLKSTYLMDFTDDQVDEDSFVSLALQNIQEFYHIDEPRMASLISHEYHYQSLAPTNFASWRDSYLRFCGALYIRTPVELLARYASRLNAMVFRYQFSYKSSTSIYPDYLTGALGEEIIFGFPTENTEMDEKDTAVSDMFLSSWTNFIKTGDPSTPQQKWLPFNEMEKNLIEFTKDGMHMSTTNILDHDVHFWRQVFLPLVKSMGGQTTTTKSNVAVTPTSTSTGPSESNGIGYVSITVIIAICALSLAFLVHFVRKFQKRYASTYKS